MLGAPDDPQSYRHAPRRERGDGHRHPQRTRPTSNIAFTVREIAPDISIVASANVARVGRYRSHGGSRSRRPTRPDPRLRHGRPRPRARRPQPRHRRDRRSADRRMRAPAGPASCGHDAGRRPTRARFGLGIIGVWNRGQFEIAMAETVLEPSTILLLAGTPEQLRALRRTARSSMRACPHHKLIIGGGRVGRAAGDVFARRGHLVHHRRALAERQRPGVRYVDRRRRRPLRVLEEAGLDEATAVLVTIHDDDINVVPHPLPTQACDPTSASSPGPDSTATCRRSTGPAPTPCCRTPPPGRPPSGITSTTTRPCSCRQG